MKLKRNYFQQKDKIILKKFFPSYFISLNVFIYFLKKKGKFHYKKRLECSYILMEHNKEHFLSAVRFRDYCARFNFFICNESARKCFLILVIRIGKKFFVL